MGDPLEFDYSLHLTEAKEAMFKAGIQRGIQKAQAIFDAEAVVATVRAVADSRASGRADERAAIVAWLRSDAGPAELPSFFINEIERGVHLRADDE